VLFAVACGVLGLGQLQRQSRTARAFQPAAGDAIADLSRRELPPRSLLLLAPALHAAFADAEREERARPDLVPAPKPWRLELAGAEQLSARQPELKPLLRAELLRPDPADDEPGVPLVELQALAAQRPVLLEFEPALERGAARALLPAGLYQQVVTSPVNKTDLQLAAQASDRRWQRLYAHMDLARLPDPARALLTARQRAAIDHARTLHDPALEALATARLQALSEAGPTRSPLP
jgi:hypothetical protein